MTVVFLRDYGLHRVGDRREIARGVAEELIRRGFCREETQRDRRETEPEAGRDSESGRNLESSRDSESTADSELAAEQNRKVPRRDKMIRKYRDKAHAR